MAFYQFQQAQKIPASLDAVWDFISNPNNLKEITPDYLAFKVTSNTAATMYAGMIITYTVKPLLGIPLQWVTEITHVQDKAYFVDEQRVGPYTMWHHEHQIQPIENGVLMTDIVSYIPPFGFIGAMANALLIKKQLQGIFSYRTLAIEKRFGQFEPQ